MRSARRLLVTAHLVAALSLACNGRTTSPSETNVLTVPNPPPNAFGLFITAGETVHATISGSSRLDGEDWTGANCDHKACVMARVATRGPGVLSVRLTWSGPQNELGVFISTGFFGGQGAWGSSPLEASLNVRGGESLVVVSFDRTNGATPSQSAGQAFDLATAFEAR